ncbi:uncharacterized protein LOC121739338 [Aricia agestis]|uniref:uncharacterized protein LOC121739338 n=1 Tax=Aricia agestis TaxID=91739 RepID=UPI001C209A72|nr:uncharacterized protein LOC121739338 [Aricia agestis]
MAAERKETLPHEGTSNSGESLPELNSGCSHRILGGSNVMQPLEFEETRRVTEERRANEEDKRKPEDRRPNEEENSIKIKKYARTTYVQQTFHKSMFLKTRPNPRIESPNRQDNTLHCLTPDMSPDKDTETRTPSNPPDWQRIPVARSNKRKKLSQTPSPEGIATRNSFSNLPIDETESHNIAQEKRVSKPPPIILYGIDDVNKLTQLLESVADKNCFSFKIVNRNQLRISCKDVETYKHIITTVRSNGLIGHTFNIKDQRLYRLVIKNLHYTTPHTEIIQEIENTGNKVYGEIINAKYGSDKKPTSTFFVNIVPGPNNKESKI